MARNTVVLLHGQPDTSASFWALRRELSLRLPAGTRVLAPDRPGYGANPLPALDYAGNVSWLRRWLQRVESGPVLLVGHSWAGGVAALAAAAGSGLPVTGLLLLSSVGPDCLQPIDPVLGLPVVGEAIAYSTLQLARPLLRRKARTALYGHLPEQDRPYARTSGYAMRHRPVWRSFLTEQRALLRELPSINQALGRIAVPTTVVAGTRDSWIPAATPAALVSAIPRANRVDLDGGHDLQLRQPSGVAEQIAALATHELD